MNASSAPLPSWLAVLDFEATCEDRHLITQSDWRLDQQEIIELPVALISVEERAVVHRFNQLIRPTYQPILTPFCTQLTSIEQYELNDQPTIVEAIETFETWLTELGITAETALAVTCGDWDLESMWPRQAALVPELKTPALFKRWCNLKVIFKEATGYRKGVGMMGMLRQLRLTHQGHHHRGEDDVTNLSAVVVSLLERGAQFRPTWGEPERRREHKRLSRKLNQLNQQLKERRAALDNLPDHVAEEVAHHIHVQIDTITAEQNRLEAYLRARH